MSIFLGADEMKKIALITLVLSAWGCTWVKPSSQSHEIILAKPNQVVNCVKKGITTSKTLSKVVIVPRSNDKVFSELVMLAKNEAVILGGDTVVAEGELMDGAQSFGVYRCR
jgi:hypothetical protein